MGQTNWIFDGVQRYKEYREEVGSDSAGAIQYQTIQARTVWQFKRYYLFSTVSYSIDGGDVGTSSNGLAITAYQSGIFISATIVVGGNGIGEWICMGDDIEPTELGLGCLKRIQTWEKRDTWADYSWPGHAAVP